MSVDLRSLEEVVERAVERALARSRSEELREVAEAIKALAEYVREFVRYQQSFNEELKRFMDEQMKKWEENDRRWRENDARWEKMFRFVEEQLKFNRWVERALIEIRESLGGAYEYYTAHWIELYLAEKGYRCKTIVNVTLPIDGEKEIDVLCRDPLVVGEATVSIKSIDDAEKKIAKLLEATEAAEKFYKRKIFMKVLAVENAPEEIVAYLRRRAEELGIVLVVGREY
ncbi:conserved hypothetical protein [Ignisphaera aggregans DSM 17230]|uniref:DUF3782 domain-containing protein n=1 Tax=Ignisphaera aggregans (strain DSM 17230 / JCM 13409 / AQ1.S1) TaxID=583356 RepID=E0SSW4_IGNAA|nr:conserved hypothetical protein [Ignisphaera aggregans DSM 17230]